jgi:hypothetical protein
MSSIEHLVQATDFVIESLAGDGSGTETLPREADNDNPSTKEQRPTILLIDDASAICGPTVCWWIIPCRIPAVWR